MGSGIAEIHRHYPQYPKISTLYQHMRKDVEMDVDDSRQKNL